LALAVVVAVELEETVQEVPHLPSLAAAAEAECPDHTRGRSSSPLEESDFKAETEATQTPVAAYSAVAVVVVVREQTDRTQTSLPIKVVTVALVTMLRRFVGKPLLLPITQVAVAVEEHQAGLEARAEEELVVTQAQPIRAGVAVAIQALVAPCMQAAQESFS
jgi:hypothetical protein